MFEWQALEYEYREKHPNWFWWVGGGALVFILLSIIFANFLLAIIFFLGGFTVLMYGARPPQLINFSVAPAGIRIKDRLYHYDNLKSFWLSDEDPERRRLIIESEKIFLPHLILPLAAEVKGEEVREYLLTLLPEVRHEDSLADILGDLLGF